MARVVPEAYAIDFGTSNSLLCAAWRDGCSEPIDLDPGADDPSVLKSVLFFAPGDGWSLGSAAIAEYARYSAQGRLFRSIKKYLPDRSFTSTQVGSRKMKLEELIAIFLRRMRETANRFFDADVSRVVMGRPARFSADDEEDALAEGRLVQAAKLAGFSDVTAYPEPLAAARDFRRTLKSPQLVLVADLGAGTSDFTVLRLRPDGYSADDVLSVGGVSVAGDAFDSSIMRGQIARHFGSEARYTVPFGSNVLGMPRSLIEALCSPAEAALLQRRDVMAFLKEIRNGSVDEAHAENVDRLIALAEDCLGYAVFQAIERSKCALSSELEAPFVFDSPGVEISDRILRGDFDRMSATSQKGLLGALDATVSRAGVTPADIDCVCLTGGTSKAPFVRAALTERFGEEKILSHRSFHSVVEGLAQHARAELG